MLTTTKRDLSPLEIDLQNRVNRRCKIRNIRPHHKYTTCRSMMVDLFGDHWGSGCFMFIKGEWWDWIVDG